MKNGWRKGSVISDNEIKVVKKLTKNQVIVVPSNITNDYFDTDLVGAKIKITSIRKYKSYFNDYAYEIDVIVDMNSASWIRSNYRCQRYARRHNGWYRTSILKILYSETVLKYVNIDTNKTIISKIKYQYIP